MWIPEGEADCKMDQRWVSEDAWRIFCSPRSLALFFLALLPVGMYSVSLSHFSTCCTIRAVWDAAVVFIGIQLGPRVSVSFALLFSCLRSFFFFLCRVFTAKLLIGPFKGSSYTHQCSWVQCTHAGCLVCVRVYLWHIGGYLECSQPTALQLTIKRARVHLEKVKAQSAFSCEKLIPGQLAGSLGFTYWLKLYLLPLLLSFFFLSLLLSEATRHWYTSSRQLTLYSLKNTAARERERKKNIYRKMKERDSRVCLSVTLTLDTRL